MQKIIHERYTGYTDKIPFSLKIGRDCTKCTSVTELNWHENLEMQLITKGSGFALINGKKYKVEKGEIIVINSNTLHSTFTDDFMSYDRIIINDEWCRRMNISYKILNFCSVIRDEKIEELFLNLEKVLQNPDDIMCVAEANEGLLKLMIELVRNYCDIQNLISAESKYIDSVVSAIEYIYNNYNQKISLAEISQKALLNKYQLCREFKKYTGYTIFEYMNHYRSLKAIDFLSEGRSVNETAELCGFGNVSYFTQSFKKYIGKSPSQYKGNTHV